MGKPEASKPLGLWQKQHPGPFHSLRLISHICPFPLPHLIPVTGLKPLVTGIDCFQEHVKQTTPTRGSRVQKVQTMYKETMIR